MGPHPAIFFLSDYGNADEFVGVVHAVVHRLAPSVPVIDLSHEVVPFDIAAGAAMLARALPSLGPGVVLAVVDPGVGSKRRPIAVRSDGDGPDWLVGPDNGLLIEACEALGGPAAAFALDPQRLLPPWAGKGTGPTFDGRDVFAPAASHLASGGDPLTIGSAVGAETLVVLDPRSPGSGPTSAIDGSAVSAPVTWIDRYGNVQLDLLPSDLDEIGVDATGLVQVSLASDPDTGSVLARRVWAFSDLRVGEFGLLVDGNGRVALVLDRASAASRLIGTGARVGVVVRIMAADESFG